MFIISTHTPSKLTGSTVFQVFLLVNENTVKQYKTNLADEIEPAISELIERAEQGLASLEKTQQLLETNVSAGCRRNLSTYPPILG